MKRFWKRVSKRLFGDPCIGTTKHGLKVYVRGPGVAYVDGEELMRSEELQQLLRDAPKIVAASQRQLQASRRQLAQEEGP